MTFGSRMPFPDLIWIDSAPVNGLVRFFQLLQELVVVAPYISPLIHSQSMRSCAWLSRAERHSEYRGDNLVVFHSSLLVRTYTTRSTVERSVGRLTYGPFLMSPKTFTQNSLEDLAGTTFRQFGI
jgi:hypothetical protein